MRYIQFYSLSTGYVEGSIPPRFDGPKEPIPALGTYAVILADARCRMGLTIEVGRRHLATHPNFVGFRVFEGQSFSDSRPVTGYFPREEV